MTDKILCKWHKEDTPSLHIYENGYHCFGCGKHGPLTDLELPPGRPKYVENVTETIEYIRTLPIKAIRRLQMPQDATFYYILWPNLNYYKRRLISDSGESGRSSKYLCPSGNPKPLFFASHGDEQHLDTLYIVEGEINALSLAECYPNCADAICSPGGAAEFTSRKYLTEYKRYGRFVLVADNDPAGIQALTDLKKELLRHSPYVHCIAMDKDFNDLLQESKDISEYKKTVDGLLSLSLHHARKQQGL